MKENKYWNLIHQARVGEDFVQAAKLCKKLFRKTKDVGALVFYCEYSRLIGDVSALSEGLKVVEIEHIRNSLGIHGDYLIAEKLKTISIDELQFLKDINWNESPNANALGNIFEKNEILTAFEGFEILDKESQVPHKNDVIDLQEKILCTPPKIIHSDKRAALKNRREYHVDAFACGNVEFRNAQVQVGSNTVISDGVAYVDEYRNEFGNLASPHNDPVIVGYRDDKVLSRIPSDNVFSLPSGFWMAGAGVKEFGHFVNSHLVKFQYFKHHPMWGKWPLYVPSGLPKATREFLNFYMGAGVKFLELDEGIRYFPASIIVVPSRVFSPLNMRSAGNTRPRAHVFVDPKQFERLKLELLSAVKNDTYRDSKKKIYVSRDGYTRRNLVNREDLDNRMHSQKLKKVCMNNLSAAEQICQLRDSDMIVAEVASWIYLCHVAEDVKIVGLMSDYDHPMWSDLSGLKSAMGMGEIDLILGKRVGTKKALSFENENSQHLPWSLSLKALDALDSQISLR
jgi:hypothetical protein